MIRVAIMVDGGFYRKRANYLWGEKTAEDRANEIYNYCRSHVGRNYLYRVFYYDCLPIKKTVFHPMLNKNIHLGKSDTYTWATTFFEKLKQKRKFALRLGELSDTNAGYNLKVESTKNLITGKISLKDLSNKDFELVGVEQKGVDMKIGTDIASVVFKGQVDQIILIAGDSDFVPASKLARREGIDFILDPLWANIKPSLFEHIDGLKSKCENVKFQKNPK